MVRLIALRSFAGGGSLMPVEFDAELPFTPKRMFWVSGLNAESVRGEHAHRKCHQLIIAMSGRFTVTSDDGKAAQEFALGSTPQALYVPPLTWLRLHAFNPDSVLFCLASEPYEVADYIDAKDEFLRLAEASKTVEHHQV